MSSRNLHTSRAHRKAGSASRRGTIGSAMRRIVTLVMSAALLLALSGSSLAEVRYGKIPFPTGVVGYAKPAIGMVVVTTDKDAITGASLTMDGKLQPMRREGSLIVHRPAEPLAPGRHSVEIKVEFNSNRWLPLEKKWEFEVAPDALQELPPSGIAAMTALDALNRIRRDADLSPLTLDRSLNAAATAHAGYFVANPTEGLGAHDEVPGLSGFTGTKPWERGAYFGYPYHNYYENMHFIDDHTRAVRDWLDSVYHRFPLIDPAMNHIGYGYATDGRESVNVLQVATPNWPSPGPKTAEPLARSNGFTLIAYPTPGRMNVPTRWDGREIPDPYRVFPGSKAAGYPITIQFLKSEVEWSRVDSATITGQDGTDLDFWLLTPENDDFISPNIALLPVDNLLPGRRYNVSVQGMVKLKGGSYQPFAKTWWFTTAGRQERVYLNPGVTILLDGKPLVADVEPAIKNDRTMLPLRAFFESLGASVTWDASRYNVTADRGGRRIFLKIGNNRAVVDDREILLDAAPFITHSRALVPVRFVAENFGLRVNWDGETRTVYLFTTPAETPSDGTVLQADQ